MAARTGDPHLRVLPDGRLHLDLEQLPVTGNAARWLIQLRDFHDLQATANTPLQHDQLADLLDRFGQLRLAAPPDTGPSARLVARRIIDRTAHLVEQLHDQPHHLVELVRLPLADQELRVRLSRRAAAHGDLLLVEELSEGLSYDASSATDDTELAPVVRFSLWLMSLWMPSADHRQALQSFTQLDHTGQLAAIALMEDWEGADTEFLDVADRLSHAGFLAPR